MRNIPDDERTIELLEARGFCVEEWERWHQGQCGTYAVVLIALDPSLRFGLIGNLHGDEPWFDWQHAIAHDDEFAYDAGGRHTLPYKGAWGDYEHAELDLDPEDYGIPDDEAGPEGVASNLSAAIAHARRNRILEGAFTPDYRPDPTDGMSNAEMREHNERMENDRAYRDMIHYERN